MSTLFSAVVKPEKPLLYLCEEATLITNIAISPISKMSQTTACLPAFVTMLKLQYEGPVIEGEKEDEQVRPNKKAAPGGRKDKPAGDESDSDEANSEALDTEAKEVVIGCFTPSTLQITTDLWLAPDDQYRFVLSGSAEYEVHLLGRYLSGSANETPDEYDSDDSDEDMDDFTMEQLMGEDDESGESASGRIQEIDSEDEKPVKSKAKSESHTKSAAKDDGPKPQPPGETNPKKRPLPDQADVSGDISMADSACSAPGDKTKLSKSQRKKLKKLAQQSGGPAQKNDSPGKDKKGGDEAQKSTLNSKPTAATVTLPSGLKITDTKLGEGSEAKPGQQVAMRYIGKLQNGKVFDSNTKGKPFTFRLGKGEVIKGWDEGIKGMKLGGERRLLVPAALAYGKSGAPPDIPPNATLQFEVKLLSTK